MTLEWVSRLSNSYIVAEGDCPFLHRILCISSSSTQFLASVTCGGGRFGSTRVPSATFPAFGLLMCNMILHGLGISWVKDGSFDDGRNLGLEMATHPSLKGFSTPLLLVPLALLPWICTCTLSPAQSTKGVRIASRHLTGCRRFAYLALGSGVGRVDDHRMEHGDTLSTFWLGIIPWGTYLGVLLTAATCSPLVFRSRFSGFRSTSPPSRTVCCAAMPVIVMLSGVVRWVSRFLSITQMACVVFLLTDSDRAGIQHSSRDEFMLVWALHALSSQMFHASGHRRAFDGLHFASAGFKKFNFFVMGILLAINTWSGDILACASLPAASSAMIRRRVPPGRWGEWGDDDIRFVCRLADEIFVWDTACCAQLRC